MALLRIEILLLLILLSFSCKTVKQTERRQAIQRHTSTQIDRMKVLRDSIHLKTNVTSHQIVFKYSEPDTAGMQYIEDVTITGKEANTWLDKEQNKTEETTKKENIKETESIQEESEKKQESRPFSNLGSIVALVFGVLVCVIVLRIVLVKKR